MPGCTGQLAYQIIPAMTTQRFYRGWALRALALVAGFSAFSLSDQHAPLVTPAVAGSTEVLPDPAPPDAQPAPVAPGPGMVAAAAGDDTPEERVDVARVDLSALPPFRTPVPASASATGSRDGAGRAYASPPGPAVEAARAFSRPQPLPQPLYQGLQSEQVRALQIRLRHAKALAAYDADGIFGPVTHAAVLRFQRRNELPATGIVHQETWDALLAQSHDPTPAEMSNTDVGPWFVNPRQQVWMMELQDRLRQVGAYAGAMHGELDAATRLAIARYRQQLGLPDSEVMDERTWARLLRVTHNPSYADLFDALPEHAGAQELDPRCLSGKVVCISKEQQKLSFVVDGDIRFTRQARFSLPQYDSPEGDFRVWYKNRDTISRKFGERIPMPYAIFYEGDVAVHFSDDFAENGYDGGSHGCSQLDDYRAAKWLYEQVAVGDRVVVY